MLLWRLRAHFGPGRSRGTLDSNKRPERDELHPHPAGGATRFALRPWPDQGGPKYGRIHTSKWRRAPWTADTSRLKNGDRERQLHLGDWLLAAVFPSRGGYPTRRTRELWQARKGPPPSSLSSMLFL